MLKWVTSDGTEIPYDQLSDSHLINCLRMLQRRLDALEEKDDGSDYWVGKIEEVQELQDGLIQEQVRRIKPTRLRTKKEANDAS